MNAQVQWKAYPALLLAGCFAVGITGASGIPAVTFWGWTGVLGLALGAGLVAALYERVRFVSSAPLCWTIAVAVGAVASGGMRGVIHHSLPPHDVGHWVQTAPTGTVEGRVSAWPVQTEYGLRFILEARHYLGRSDTVTVTGRIQVVLSRPTDGPPFPEVRRGHLLRLYGTLRPLPRPRNPADFDYGSYLQQRGISATLTLYDSAAVTILGTDRTPAERLTVPVRHYAERHLHQLIPSEACRAILAALLLGDRSGIDDVTRDRFARTGLLHLLAVSGLHVFFVGMLLYALLGPLLTRLGLAWTAREAVRSTGTMGLLIVYMLLTGASASVVRAVVMAALFVGGAVLQRPVNHLNALGAAALVLLLGNPDQLFMPGFQLSFAAVAAIVTIHPVLFSWVPPAWQDRWLGRHVLSTLTVSLAALLGTMPVQLFHFGQASASGILLNLVAIPATALSLGAGLLALLLAGWLPFAAGVFGEAATVLTSFLLVTAEGGARWLSWATLNVTPGRLQYLPALGAMLVMMAQAPRPRLRWRWGIVTLYLAVGSVWLPVLRAEQQPGLGVIFFDVGHGDAALVSLPNGRRLLIDAGARDAFTDQGTRTILPHLKRFGIPRLDAVVVSHPHSDHLGGLPGLLRAIPVGRVLHNGRPAHTALYTETTRLLDSLHIPHHPVHAGDTLNLDPSVRVQVLSPERSRVDIDDANDASVVLRIAYRHHVFLFTGDAEAAAEQRLLARYGSLLQSDVVKVGHHGSRTSSIPPFVSRVSTGANPIALVSVGSHRQFGLPDEEVLQRWQTHGAALWVTRHQGALWIRSDGARLFLIPWRRR